MVAWSRQRQPLAGGKFNMLAFRHCMWTTFLAIILFGFFVSHELMYFQLRRRQSLRKPFDVHNTVNDPPPDDTLLEFAQMKPEGFDDRDKIRYLLEKTDSGRISIRDVLYPSQQLSRRSVFTAIRSASKISGRAGLVPANRIAKEGNAWMLPLTSKRLAVHVPKFIQVAKEWLGVSDYDLKVMQDLVEKVKKPIDRNLAFWTKNESSLTKGRTRYASCAVVGNSGILLNGSYGEQIDSHEMVIRLNNAEIFNYTKHVGSKTTISFMNSNVFRLCAARPGCWCHPYGDDVPIVIYICQAQHLMLASVCGSVHKSPLLITPSLLDNLCAMIVKWYSAKNFMSTTGRGIDEWDAVHHGIYFHYSSGMQAVVLALGICDRVDIYGFGKSVQASHHYHTNQKKELDLHDYVAEYIFYDDLVNNRTIPFLSDSGISIPRVQIFY